eukprot:2334859-Rhodomonas_salina.1
MCSDSETRRVYSSLSLQRLAAMPRGSDHAGGGLGVDGKAGDVGDTLQNQMQGTVQLQYNLNQECGFLYWIMQCTEANLNGSEYHDKFGHLLK